jgi:hypothetical protein
MSRAVAVVQNFFVAQAENAELRDIEGRRFTTKVLILLTCDIRGNVIR